MFVGTWWSLMPAIIAIALALITKEVYISLFAAVHLEHFLSLVFIRGRHLTHCITQ